MASSGRVKAEPGVKPDPEDAGASPAAFVDDDVYEDAGDLEFWDSNLPADPYGSVYLTRVPDFLWQAWSHLDDDAEIRIGTLRQWNEQGPNGEQQTHLRMLLNGQIAEHQALPKEYHLDIKDMALTNSFLFSEKDLPGYKNRALGPNSDIPPHLRPRLNASRPQDKQQQQQPQNAGRKARYQPYYRKAIPKKTKLEGRFRHELSARPVDNEETKRIMTQRALDALQPKKTTSMMEGGRGVGRGIIQAGTARANEKFGGFVKTTVEPKKGKKQKAERAARISQSEIRDRIFKLFELYKYYPMRALKEQLDQPEAWIRENMEEIAVLHKTGKWANRWELRPEYQKANIQTVQDVAPVKSEGESSESEDEDMQMEDVA